MAIGVSAMQLRSGNFHEDILEILRQTGLEPQSLELGLAERILMRQAKSAEPSLRALRETGVQVAIDDFGTGYSGLSYLRKFPIDALRIDQSFIRQISREGDAVIVAALIDMVKGLKLRAVAKGVATRAELEFLQARRCDEAQGYYFSRPLRPEQFAARLKSDARVFAPPSLA
jgi:EAL domain-containing protein (putative c-di-GMP-specific phosphodiesterase class I)